MGDSLLTQRLADLGRVKPDAVTWIEPWLRESSEEDVYRACPVRWAEERGLDPDDAVDMLLHATQAGLLRIAWEANCPGCGMLIEAVERLGDVDNHFQCALCDESKELALDDWIMVTFSVREEVRRVRYHAPDELALRDRIIYCDSGRAIVMEGGEPLLPYLQRKMFIAETLEPGAVATAQFEAEKGIFLVAPKAGVPIAGDSREPVQLDLSVNSDGLLSGLPNRLPVGPVSMTVRNVSSDTVPVWGMQSECFLRFREPFGYAAARLIHHPVYRALFPSHLACSGGIVIRDVSLLFSDLVESTAMYQDIGDLRAYEKVREHFATMAPVIERHRGLWVKDIGDAVMASFTSAEAAVAAALEMHRVVREQVDLRLKVGIHSGACIGVTSRGGLDWFGSTVNLAARIQSLAGPGEICLSDETFGRARSVLAGLSSSQFDTGVRGIEQPITVHRFAVQ